jgi:hypothetical protein
VKEQMATAPLTVDIYGHLIPGAYLSRVDRPDDVFRSILKNNSPPKRDQGLDLLVAASGLEPLTYGL